MARNSSKTSKKPLTMDNFGIFTIESFKNNPDSVAFNLYKKSKKIYVRKETEEMKDYHTFTLAKELIEEMDSNGYIDINTKVTIKFLLDAYMAGDIILNVNELTDEGQRNGDVMPIKNQHGINLSLLNGDSALPEIQMIVDNGKLRVIDGMQRLVAIIKYLTERRAINYTNTILDGYTFDELPAEIKRIFFERLIRIHVMHSSLIDYRAHFFKTYNTTSTRMSVGELINTKYNDHEFTQIARDLMDNSYVKKVFLGIDKERDLRLDGESEILYCVASYFYALMGLPRGIGGGKNAFVDGFYDDKLVYDNIDEVRKIFSITDIVSEKIVRNFGISFNKTIGVDTKAGTRRATVSGPNFPNGYMPYHRRHKVCPANTAVVFFVVMGLYDIIDTMKKEHIKEIAMNIDEVLGSDSFKLNFNVSMNAKKAVNRLHYVWETAVEPVLNKYNYTV